ncbi:MAG: hypothetical protein WC975_06065 [Phycisphaerae bacterium]
MGTNDLYLHGRKLESIFELLGSNENDITYSIGWSLSQSPSFLHNVLSRIFPGSRKLNVDKISLQEYKQGCGITDIEIASGEFHTIIEAKRGWQLPNRKQLQCYVQRLKDGSRRQRALVVMAECSPEYVQFHLPNSLQGIPVVYLSWREIARLTRIERGSHAEKRVMEQLQSYLQRIVRMQNQESNMVFVVALGAACPSWSKIAWRDFVNRKQRYFHPFGKNWPVEPPNYLGFRYNGQLQSIHHVDSCKVVEDMHAEFPEIDPGKWDPHLLYTLSPPIVPVKTVKTGNIFCNGRVWAMLDLLLSCDTIAQARDRTKKRQSEVE